MNGRTGGLRAHAALLIAAEGNGLQAPRSDGHLMRDALTAFGFRCDVLSGAEATRAGILAAYERLVQTTEPDDSVVVYFSGHGSRCEERDWSAEFILPTDAEPHGTEFNGILAEELSTLLWRLTERTKNVVTIWDCCHSARMGRDPDMLPRARPDVWPEDLVRARWEEARRANPLSGRLEANPHAVRITACAPKDVAWEGPFGPDGEWHGALTLALSELLEAAAEVPMSWATLADRLHRRTFEVAPQQATVYAPVPERRVFTLEPMQQPGSLPVNVTGGVAWIPRAIPLGIAVGDRFEVSGPKADMGTSAVVEHLDGGRAVLTPPPEGDGPFSAHPVFAKEHAAVALQLSGALRTTLTHRIERAGLRVARPGEPAIGRVIEADGGLEVLDHAGARLFDEATPGNEAGIADIIGDLTCLAMAHRIRRLASGEGDQELDTPVEIEWARIDSDGLHERLEMRGAQLFAGEVFTLGITNRGRQPVFASVLDIGISGSVAIASASEARGVEIAPGSTYRLGEREGLALEWPEEVPADGPRDESLVVIISDARHNLGPLQQGGISGSRAPSAGTSLDGIIHQVAGGVRVPEDPDATAVRYGVHHIEFTLHPAAAPRLDEPAFAIDERPDLSMRLMVPRSAPDAPEAVAVRLVELVVEHNRALRNADIRIDALVLTPGADGPDVYHAQTMRFPRVGKGERLPLDNVLLFAGGVQRFLDIAVWVSRDDPRGRDLLDLLLGQVENPEVQTALNALGAVVAGPLGAAAGSVLGGVATMVRAAGKLVGDASPASIGLYRTSFLPHERFGVGRHPGSGLLIAQDMSLALEVVPI